MNTNEIGTMYGLFYEEWAIALETRGNSAQADKVYEMGIRKYVLQSCIHNANQPTKRSAAFGTLAQMPPTFSTTPHRIHSKDRE